MIGSYDLDTKLSGQLSGKELPPNAGAARESGSIPGLGKSPKGSMATCSRILAWKIPWTEGPVGLQLMGWQKVRHD